MKKCSVGMWLVRSLLFATVILLTGCDEQIIHDLTESEANRLLTKLGSVAIHAGKERQADGRWALSVPKSDSLRALSFLSDSRVLKDDRPSPESNTGMVMNRDDERYSYERRLSGGIESTIAAIPGVLEARVHLNLPPLDPLFGTPMSNSAGSASVLVLRSLKNEVSEASIRSIVAGSSGIPAEKITVVVDLGITEESGPIVSALPESIEVGTFRELTKGPVTILLVVIAGVLGAVAAKLFANKKSIRELVEIHDPQ